MAKRANRPKYVPQRTCIGCRQTKPKRELLRLVRTAEGSVVVDETGKRAGRGAYLCKQASCWLTALKRQGLDRALRTELDEATRVQLSEFAQGLSEEEAPVTQ